VFSLGKKGVNHRILFTIVLFFIVITAISFLSTDTPTGLTTADDKYADLFSAAGNETQEEAEPLLEPTPEPQQEPTVAPTEEPEEPNPEPISPALAPTLTPLAVNLSSFIRQHVPEDLWSMYDTLLLNEESQINLSEQTTPYTPTAQPQAIGPAAIVNVATCVGDASNNGVGSGDVVNVTANLSHSTGSSCIGMDVAHTILECNGFAIIGSGSVDDGVNVTATNVTVRNCIIKDLPSAGSDAIRVFGTGNNFRIYNNTLYNNSDDGVQATSVSDGLIANNTIYNNDGEGIIIFSAARGINITGNTIYDNSPPTATGQISIGGSGLSEVGDNFVIAHNNITSNISDLINYLGDDSGGDTSSSGLHIINNTLTIPGASFKAIDGDRFDNVLVENNTQFKRSARMELDNGINITVRNNTLNGSVFSFGFTRTVTNLLIEDNTWQSDLDTSTLISLAASVITAENVTIRNHDNVFMSFNCFTCHNSSIEDNNLTENAQAAGNGVNFNVTRNRLENLDVVFGTSGGIRTSQPITFTNDVNIYDNILAGGRMYSILVSGDNVVVDNNTIANMTGQGIDVRASFVNVTNNTFYNFSGIAIRLRENDTRVIDNDLTFILELDDTQFNFNTTTPQIPEGSVGFRLDNLTNRINISQNTITVTNPSNLEVGIIGIDVEKTNQGYFADNTFLGTKIGMFIRDSVRSDIFDNTLRNSTYKSIIIEAGRQNDIQRNFIRGADNIIPSLYESGIQLYRTQENTIGFTNITEYHTGVHLLNSSSNRLDNMTIIDARGHGIFAVQSNTNNYTGINASTGVRTGIKLLFSNNSIINASTLDNTFRSIDLHQSHFNRIAENTLDSSIFGLGLDLFSSNNTINDNIFGGSIITSDILLDMFATANTGTGNGGPTNTTENGANANTIT